MKKKLLLSAMLLLLYIGVASAQRMGVWAVAFYNLEHLFDTVDEPNNPGDDEFLPNGPCHLPEDSMSKSDPIWLVSYRVLPVSTVPSDRP